jgi:hydroxyacylglutathione hydrolase
MLLRYFYHPKLAHASYLVGCQATGEAIVIDPGRQVEQYISAAIDEGLRLTAVAETHIHADYLSGSVEMAHRTGATLYLSAEGGDEWQYGFRDNYSHQLLHEGATFPVGNIRFDVWHTPGHTPEHLAFLVTDSRSADRPMGIFSGDFVFVGDVGRPDLLEQAVGMADTAVAGARQMFHSLQRFKQLPDYLQIWPAHGAGSACGKALGAVPSTTVGYERLFNWALQQTVADRFVAELLTGQPETPRYFAQMKRLNKDGPPHLPHHWLPPQLPLEQITSLLADGATIIDTRGPGAFARGHIPGSINIAYDNSFTNWAGWLVAYDRPFYLVTGAATLPALVADLQYIGLDHIGGYFDAATLAIWQAATRQQRSYPVKTVAQLSDTILKQEVQVVDVRSQAEWDQGHIPGAQHIMLGELPQRLDELPRDRPLVVQCSTGARSAIAASILQRDGFDPVINLKGGLDAWTAAGLPVVE